MCEAAGIKDILTKCITSNNPLNVILATLQGFKQMNTDLEIFDLRNEPRSEQNEVAKDANN